MERDLIDLTTPGTVKEAQTGGRRSPGAGGEGSGCGDVVLVSQQTCDESPGRPVALYESLPDGSLSISAIADRHEDGQVAVDNQPLNRTTAFSHIGEQSSDRSISCCTLSSSESPVTTRNREIIAVELETFVTGRLAEAGTANDGSVHERSERSGSLPCSATAGTAGDEKEWQDRDDGLDNPVVKRRRTKGSCGEAEHAWVDGENSGTVGKVAEKNEKKKELERKKTERQAQRQLLLEQKERRKQLQKELRLQKKQAKQQERQQRAQEREDARRNRGSHALEEIQALISTSLAKCELGVETFRCLQQEKLGYDVVPLPLVRRWCVQWKHERAASRPVQQGNKPECSQTEEGAVPHLQRPPEAEESTGTGLVQKVPYVLVAFQAEAFVKEVLEDGLHSFFCEAAQEHSDCTLCLLVVGLESYLQRREKQEFRKGSLAGNAFCRAKIDEFLVQLTTHHPGVRYKVVADVLQGAQHIAALTAGLAKKTYYRTGNFLEKFGGAKGVDSLKDLEVVVKDTTQHCAAFARILHSIPGVGPRDALGVAMVYPSFGALMTAYNGENWDAAVKPNLLSNLYQPPHHKRRIGPVVSKRIHRLFVAEDPEADLGD